MGADVLATQGARASATMMLPTVKEYFGPHTLRVEYSGIGQFWHVLQGFSRV